MHKNNDFSVKNKMWFKSHQLPALDGQREREMLAKQDGQ